MTNDAYGMAVLTLWVYIWYTDCNLLLRILVVGGSDEIVIVAVLTVVVTGTTAASISPPTARVGLPCSFPPSPITLASTLASALASILKSFSPLSLFQTRPFTRPRHAAVNKICIETCAGDLTGAR